MDEELQKQMEAINARASLGQQDSTDTQYEGGGGQERSSNYNPQYLQMMQQKQAAAAPSNTAETLGKTATAAALMKAGGASMNPYVMGAALGLQALGSMQKDRYQEEVRRLQAKQQAAQNLAQTAGRMTV